MDILVRSLLAIRSPGAAGGRLHTLIFHRVHERPDPMFPDEVDAPRFDAICGWLRRWGTVLPLDEAVQMLPEHRLPPRALAITFDDGYADNHEVALPILRRHGLPATFFVATGFLGSGVMWNDRVIEALRRPAVATLPAARLGLAAVPDLSVGTLAERTHAVGVLLASIKYLAPDDRLAAVERVEAAAGSGKAPALMMQPEHILGLRRAGMQIGAHTVTHPILARLDTAAIQDEIDGSKRALEDILAEPVRLFAYPNGKPGADYDARAVDAVARAGFDAAFTTARGVSASSSPRFELPRFTPWDRSRLRFGLRLAGSSSHAPAGAPVTRPPEPAQVAAAVAGEPPSR